MKRVCLFLFAGLLAAACGQGSAELLKVNIDRALKHPAGARDVFSEAAAIPLRCPDGIALGREVKLLDVAPDRFFLLDAGRNDILAFDWNGNFVTAIGRGETILDGSIYRDRVLNVLTQDAFFEYAVTDGSLLAEYPFDSGGVTLKSLGRVDDDSVFMLGSKEGLAYGCGYLIGKLGFYSDTIPTAEYLVTRALFPAAEVEYSRFFRCGDTVYSFFSRSGQIDQYTADDFACVPYMWDFGRRQPLFTNVQKTAGRIYLAFESEGERAVLICDLKSRQYKAVPQDAFPLGIIYGGSNYAFAHGEVTRYVLR